MTQMDQPLAHSIANLERHMVRDTNQNRPGLLMVFSLDPYLNIQLKEATRNRSASTACQTMVWVFNFDVVLLCLPISSAVNQLAAVPLAKYTSASRTTKPMLVQILPIYLPN